ncbi:50S ribosomal protein P1 [Candidatus Woesearchaeota archaeon]|nr:50S ribosomal protein P1 [Candidatus Woesearchaeota archaeon]
MEYIYTAMLLHKSGKKIEESNVKKVLEAAGIKADEARVKALVAALEGVNIDEAIEKAAIPVAAPVAQAADTAHAPKGEDTKKKAEEEKKTDEQAAAGLGALFG